MPQATIKTNRKVPLTIKNTMRRGSKVPRKSIRYSLAVNSRPSLFPTGDESDDEDILEDEVHRVCPFLFMLQKNPDCTFFP